jgi:hypothetical protein
VAVSDVGMMAGFFVVAGLMVSGGFAVMFGCGFMMIGSLMMMIGAFVCHGYVSCRKVNLRKVNLREVNFEVHAYATADLLHCREDRNRYRPVAE